MNWRSMIGCRITELGIISKSVVLGYWSAKILRSRSIVFSLLGVLQLEILSQLGLSVHDLFVSDWTYPGQEKDAARETSSSTCRQKGRRGQCTRYWPSFLWERHTCFLLDSSYPYIQVSNVFYGLKFSSVVIVVIFFCIFIFCLGTT